MIELESPESYYRTEKNVLESDGTLILNKGEISQGTKLTQEFSVRYGRPCLIVQLDSVEIITAADVIRWINGQYINVLNIAGPRESKTPDGIYSDACAFLDELFATLKELP